MNRKYYSLVIDYTHHDGGRNGVSIEYMFKGGKLSRAKEA